MTDAQDSHSNETNKSPSQTTQETLISAGQKNREDVNAKSSSKKGLHGLFETVIRRFRTLSFAILLTPIMLLGCVVIGVSLAPGLWLFDLVNSATQSWPAVFHYLTIGIAFATGYLLYGLTLIFVVPLVNFLMPFRVKTFRGPWYSTASIPWYIHNALTYWVRFTFLEFITPSPLNILFFRMMGMKVGKGVVINTAYISDPALITIEDYVTIGGSVTLFAHYGQKGYLIISPVRIGKGSNIGLKASIMGGAQIGENVTVKPHTCILPKTIVADGEMI